MGAGGARGPLIRAFSLPAGRRNATGKNRETAAKKVRHNPIPLAGSLSPSALT
jgi:hypothetical protein